MEGIALVTGFAGLHVLQGNAAAMSRGRATAELTLNPGHQVAAELRLVARNADPAVHVLVIPEIVLALLDRAVRLTHSIQAEIISGSIARAADVVGIVHTQVPDGHPAGDAKRGIRRLATAVDAEGFGDIAAAVVPVVEQRTAIQRVGIPAHKR